MAIPAISRLRPDGWKPESAQCLLALCATVVTWIRMDPNIEINPERVDWRQVMLDLRDNGYSVYRVAKCLGVQHWTARNWAINGGEPGHANGEALLKLHHQVAQRIGVQDQEQAITL